jgi:iron complex outermembrane receptor protein
MDESFNFFNPKFGLNYDITPNHKVYASYAIAHKEPTRNNFENNINAELEMPKAERLNDLEIGYKYQSTVFTAGANFYWMNYKDQFVLTGEIDKIGEAITRNVDKSYRLGVEVEAALKPVDWFRWDVNATWSKNRVKGITVQLTDKSIADLGDQPLAFSPDWIANNIFTFNYKGLNASIQSQYIGEQYMTNTGFKSYKTLDDNGQPTDVSMMLDGHFVTNIDLSYNFKLPKLGIKDATIGVTLYNLFSAEYDNNGWAAPAYEKENDKVVATGWDTSDLYEAGFAPSAPFNMMAHLSVNF